MTGRLVAVTGGKGGPGATTLSVGMAAALSAQGQRVLLADLDPAGGDVAAHLAALDPRRGLLPLVQLTRSGLGPSEIAAECVEMTGGLVVLAGLPRPDPGGILTADLVATLLANARELADVVIADLGRLLPGYVSTAGAQVADRVLLAVRPDLAGALAARRVLHALGESPPATRNAQQRVGAPVGRLRVVAMAADRQRPGDLAELASALDRPLLGAIAADPRGARRALDAGIPPTRGRLARGYADVAQRLAADLAGAVTGPAGAPDMNGPGPLSRRVQRRSRRRARRVAAAAPQGGAAQHLAGAPLPEYQPIPRPRGTSGRMTARRPA